MTLKNFTKLSILRYLGVCNVLHIWSVRAIPTFYKVLAKRGKRPMNHLAFRWQLILSLSEPITSSVIPRACPGPRALNRVERLWYHTISRRAQREGTVWCACSDRVKGGTRHSGVVHAPKSHPCALLAAFKSIIHNATTDRTSLFHLVLYMHHAS